MTQNDSENYKVNAIPYMYYNLTSIIKLQPVSPYSEQF